MTTSRILSLVATLLLTLTVSAVTPKTTQSVTAQPVATEVQGIGGHDTHTDRVKAQHTDVYTVTFRSGQEAWVYVSGHRQHRRVPLHLHPEVDRTVQDQNQEPRQRLQRVPNHHQRMVRSDDEPESHEEKI